MRVESTFIEPLLGTQPNNPEIHSEFIAANAPDAPTRKEEIAVMGAQEVEEKSMTIFPKDKDGKPFLWDYQIKGFFKDACGSLARAGGTKSSELKAYKKVIDGLIFPKPRQIPLVLEKGAVMGNCQRPLRGQTAQGERISLANSEQIPAGTKIVFDILILDKKYEKLVIEWLEYGELRGVGQWRNSGKGRFTFKVLD